MTCLTWCQYFPVLQDSLPSQPGKGWPTNLEEGNSSLHPHVWSIPPIQRWKQPTQQTAQWPPVATLKNMRLKHTKQCFQRSFLMASFPLLNLSVKPTEKKLQMDAAGLSQVKCLLYIGFQSGSWSLWGKKELNLSKNLTLFTPLKPIADTYSWVRDKKQDCK